jgi:hypothetical protein
MEEIKPTPVLPPPSNQSDEGRSGDQQSKTGIVLIVVAVLILILLIVAAVFLLRADVETTGKVRDVFIIFMALMSLILGVSLIILIVQLATLINLLQNELKPIIHSTNETVNTLRGTVVFLSDNLTEPVIRLNTYLSGVKTFFDLMKPGGPRR